jgi:AMP-binding enzyme
VTVTDEFEYDPFSPAAMGDPLPIYRILRDHYPVYYSERYDTFFVSRFADIWDALSRTDNTFLATEGTVVSRDLLLRHNCGPAPNPPLNLFSHHAHGSPHLQQRVHRNAQGNRQPAPRRLRPLSFHAVHHGLERGAAPAEDSRAGADVPHERLRHLGQSHFTATPTMLKRIADIPGIESRDLSSVEWIMQGAATMPPSLVHRWAKLIGAENIVMAYGMTENLGLTALRGDDWMTHQGSVGKPFRGTEIRTRDDSVKETPIERITSGSLLVGGTEYARARPPADGPGHRSGASPVGPDNPFPSAASTGKALVTAIQDFG